MTQQVNEGLAQVSPRTVYLGPEASFSHQAAVEALSHTHPIPLPSFRAILDALQCHRDGEGEIYDYAVLPVENSTNGSVVQALDLLAQCRLDPASSGYPNIEVVDEHYLEVHHFLFVSRTWAQHKLSQEELDFLDTDQGRTLDKNRLKTLLLELDIKILYTHPQVWGQCNAFLSQLLPPGRVDRVDMSSTSAAAAYVAGHTSRVQDGEEDFGIAAISSSLAGAKHKQDLVCLARNIEDDPGSNTTRFLILRNSSQPRQFNTLALPSIEACQMKSLFTFTISHYVPGSLAKTLAVFAKYDFNLSAIQSRPKPKTKITIEYNGLDAHDRQVTNWKYVFFVECLHPAREMSTMSKNDKLHELTRELRTVTEQLALLGSWPDRLSAENS